MVSKYDFIRFTKSAIRKTQRFLKSKTSQNILYGTYQTYNIIRIVRNPFILLEYVNVYNGLRLIGG
mgnify:FL=1|tara:strand:- start:290 stop:487 length:198 start_codon:yes stop_codon:yes gene_type:complete